MLVRELREAYGNSTEKFDTFRLKDISLTDEGLEFTTGRTLEWDDSLAEMTGKFLKINTGYLKKCPPELQQQNVNFWLDRNNDSDAIFHFVNRSLRGIYPPSRKIIPIAKILDIVNNVFVGGDEVKTFSMDEKMLHLDVVSNALSVEVPGHGTQERPHVGDITYGGLRWIIYLQEQKPPEVETYFNRLLCTNGASRPEVERRISLAGNSVDDVLNQLEATANILMNEMPDRLASYRHSAEIPIPGDVAQFAYQLGRENNLSQRIMDRVMAELALLPQNPSVYDITQIFTSVANEDVTFQNRLRLQRIGGQLSLDTETTLHRCAACERLL
jgi:hypothetical protein